MHRLSKSKVTSGLQCPKRLYLEIHSPELIQFSKGAERAFEIGHEVGVAAQRLFPDGILISPEQQLAVTLEQTTRQMSAHESATLFEPTFQYGSVLVKADVLVKNAERSELVEVKSSTDLKAHYLQDIAIQSWVIEGAGYPIGRSTLWHIDSSFVYPGGGDYHGLFKAIDVTDDIAPLRAAVPAWIEKCQQVLAGTEPVVAVGKQCTEPNECPFIAHCSPPTTEYPVTILPRGGKLAASLIEEGYVDLRDVPGHRLEKENHLRVWRVTRSGTAEKDTELVEQLTTLPYPRYFLDFETIQFAVPIWAGTRPYEQLPFQWSCHVQIRDGTIEHREFLDTSGEAPMRQFAESLLDALDADGPIFVYSGFEKTTIKGLIKRFPDLAVRLENVIHRFVDLLPLARDHYYHPAMKGDWSIKYVLPTIAPELSYDRLGEVRDGTAAQTAYLEIIAADTPPSRRDALAADLREYCGRDTEALVEVVRFFEDRR